uniref:HTH OST-type domain-containing protein n=1 Tax=Timema monikensis TaxID=170555 RepID=A0A7R9EKN8_9NEOP|nr:unnamed protein product [Timema monikensis]
MDWIEQAWARNNSYELGQWPLAGSTPLITPLTDTSYLGLVLSQLSRTSLEVRNTPLHSRHSLELMRQGREFTWNNSNRSAAMWRLKRAPSHRVAPNIKLISPDLTEKLVLGVGEENYLLSLRKFVESKRLPELQCKVFPLKHGGDVRYYSYIQVQHSQLHSGTTFTATFRCNIHSYIQVGDISCNTVDSGCMTATAAIQLAAKRMLHQLSGDECALGPSRATFTQLALCRILQEVCDIVSLSSLSTVTQKVCDVSLSSLSTVTQKVCDIVSLCSLSTVTQKVCDISLSSLSTVTQKLVNTHPGGLWLKNIPSEYLRVYKESVPEGWKDVVCKCPLLLKEEISDHMTIVTCSDKTWTPSLAPALTGKKSATLKLPNHHIWDVHMNSEWHRVCLKKVTGPLRGILQLIDRGGEVEDNLNMIWELKPIFASLPPQAVLCRLAGLEGFSEDINLKEQVSARINNKEFVAVVLSRTPCANVMLYDTSNKETINININMAKNISETARFPTLQVGVRQTACVSYVCPREGTLYLTMEHKKYIHYMNIMFNYLMNTDNERPNIVRPSFPVDQSKMYLVSEPEGSSWLRARANRSSQHIPKYINGAFSDNSSKTSQYISSKRAVMSTREESGEERRVKGWERGEGGKERVLCRSTIKLEESSRIAQAEEMATKCAESPSSKVEVQCIDHGKHVIVHPMQLVVLEHLSPELRSIPSQPVWAHVTSPSSTTFSVARIPSTPLENMLEDYPSLLTSSQPWPGWFGRSRSYVSTDVQQRASYTSMRYYITKLEEYKMSRQVGSLSLHGVHFKLVVSLKILWSETTFSCHLSTECDTNSTGPDSILAATC